MDVLHGELNKRGSVLIERLYINTGINLKEGKEMKVRPSAKKICDKCKVIKRKGVVRVICENPKHKQRQG